MLATESLQVALPLKLKPLRLAGISSRRTDDRCAIIAVCILHLEMDATPIFGVLLGEALTWPLLQK